MADRERLFFALWPDAAVRQSLLTVQNQFLPPRTRRVHAEDLHLTLAFLGELDADGRRRAEQAAGRARGSAFDLSLDRVDFWRRPQVFLAGAAVAPAALLELVAVLGQGLAEEGFELERRPFNPHVTLARRLHEAPSQELTVPLAWPVRDWVLVRSQVAGPAPHYQVLRRWPLAESASPAGSQPPP